MDPQSSSQKTTEKAVGQAQEDQEALLDILVPEPKFSKYQNFIFFGYLYMYHVLKLFKGNPLPIIVKNGFGHRVGIYGEHLLFLRTEVLMFWVGRAFKLNIKALSLKMSPSPSLRRNWLPHPWV
jgi:hypothetical protein